MASLTNSSAAAVDVAGAGDAQLALDNKNKKPLSDLKDESNRDNQLDNHPSSVNDPFNNMPEPEKSKLDLDPEPNLGNSTATYSGNVISLEIKSKIKSKIKSNEELVKFDPSSADAKINSDENAIERLTFLSRQIEKLRIRAEINDLLLKMHKADSAYVKNAITDITCGTYLNILYSTNFFVTSFSLLYLYVHVPFCSIVVCYLYLVAWQCNND